MVGGLQLRRCAGLAAVCCALTWQAAPAGAAPADLDRSFGRNGITEVRGPGGAPLPGEAGGRLAIGPKDEIFILYSSYQSCGDPPFECTVELTVARYTPDGRLDGSFASSSPQLTIRQDAIAHEFDIAAGPDGKPVVAALDQLGGGLFVARLDRAGHLDSSFGAGGKAQRPPTDSFDVATRGATVAVQPDGKVVAASEGIGESRGTRLLIARFLADGQPDPGFGSAGLAAVTLGTQSLPAGILLGPDGAISVPAPQCCTGGPLHFGEGFSVGRVLANGQPDPAWGGAGRLLFATPGAQATVEAVAIAPDGGILVAFEGEGSTISTVGNFVKLRPDGGLARRFGNGGTLQLFNQGRLGEHERPGRRWARPHRRRRLGRQDRRLPPAPGRAHGSHFQRRAACSPALRRQPLGVDALSRRHAVERPDRGAGRVGLLQVEELRPDRPARRRRPHALPGSEGDRCRNPARG